MANQVKVVLHSEKLDETVRYFDFSSPLCLGKGKAFSRWLIFDDEYGLESIGETASNFVIGAVGDGVNVQGIPGVTMLEILPYQLIIHRSLAVSWKQIITLLFDLLSKTYEWELDLGIMKLVEIRPGANDYRIISYSPEMEEDEEPKPEADR